MQKQCLEKTQSNRRVGGVTTLPKAMVNMRKKKLGTKMETIPYEHDEVGT